LDVIIGLLNFIKETSREKKVLERELAEARKTLAGLRRENESLQQLQQQRFVPNTSHEEHKIDRDKSTFSNMPGISRRESTSGQKHKTFEKAPVRRRHTVSEPASHLDGALATDSAFKSSLGFWFLLAQLSPHESKIEEEDHHHATVSVANDGESSVGTAAAAAISIALAKSWTSATGSKVKGSHQSLSGASDSSDMASIPKARFRLVAAVPKGPGRMSGPKRTVSEQVLFNQEDNIPFDNLDPTLETTSEWVAYGAHLKLQWMSRPRRVLVVFKLTTDALNAAVKAICSLLREDIHVVVEPKMYERVKECVRSQQDSDDSCCNILHLHTWNRGSCECSNTIPEDIISLLDLIFTVGGDGTVLWTCSLLGTLGSVPPIVAIAMGSLGFMTPFPVSRLQKTVECVVSPNSSLPLMLRHRLQCRIIRAGDMESDFSRLHKAPCGEDVLVLNELVIDRGITASLTKLDCYIDNHFMAVIQGDGLIVSTPTGSTAYNLAAGGSMVHPAVPCILFTPICPHTLSSRPLVFPEHVILRLEVPTNSRGDLYCSFDGKGRQPLGPGDSVVVYLSQSPVPMVCHLDASHDWFTSVREGLHWNRRTIQKDYQPNLP